MVWAFNTYGFRSINTHTFNGSCFSSNRVYIEDFFLEPDKAWSIPVGVRNCVNTLLRVNNLLFNVLGYFPGTREVSGPIRIGIGFSIVVVTVAIENLLGPTRGHWFTESFATGSAQIFRGCMEDMPYGSIVNGCLDVLGTVSNIWADSHFDPSKHPRHHKDPSYWLPFQFLRLV